MQASCYCIHYSRETVGVYFFRDGDQVMVDLDLKRRVVLHVKHVVEHPYLRQLYLVSLALAGDTSKLWYCGRKWYGGEHKMNHQGWCIQSQLDWKREYFTYNYDLLGGFKKNPFSKPFKPSKPRDFQHFWLELSIFQWNHARQLFFTWEVLPKFTDLVHEYIYKVIERELEEIEDEIYSDPLLVSQKYALISKKFPMDLDIREMIVSLDVCGYI